jgi:Tfp pilus assembly protein PilZ
MNVAEKRKHPRVKIRSLISYVCLDEDGRPIKNLMGTAIDISQGGLLLETTHQIEPGDVILITTDDKDRLIEINGKAAYCRKVGDGKFFVGISLQGSHNENIQFVRSMIRAYHYRRRIVKSKGPELTEDNKLS